MKRLYKVLKPIAEGGRVERGEIIELTEERAAAIGPEYVVLVDGSAETPQSSVEGEAGAKPQKAIASRKTRTKKK